MKQTRNGLLLVVSGPAGVGKGTINQTLISRNNDIRMSVSATTREPRKGEIDGVHYFFKSEEAFQKMIDEGAFLEYMRVFNTHYYGTPKSFVEQELSEGRGPERLLVTLGWWVTTHVEVDAFDPAPPSSLSFIGPVAEVLRWVQSLQRN